MAVCGGINAEDVRGRYDEELAAREDVVGCAREERKNFFASNQVRQQRVVHGRPDVTTTFKLRKVDLQREGYDPQASPDPLFVRDDGGRSYVPLSDDSLERCGLPAFSREPD